jgi:predicted nucleotidyltransferase
MEDHHPMTDRSDQLDRWTITRSEVGSTAHGVGHASNDLDEIAVYVPPPVEMLGLSCPEHYVHRPGRGPHEPSGPGDLDRTYYSLRKFVGLLVKGNPSILFALFGPERHTTELGTELRNRRGEFVNSRTRGAYLGYAKAQRERITGDRGAAGRIRRSPEGGGDVDWKYAMHMLRLGIQGVEYLATGNITLPTLHLDLLRQVRAGEVPLEDVIRMAIANEERLLAIDLPRETVSDWSWWLADAHLRAWGGRRTYQTIPEDQIEAW